MMGLIWASPEFWGYLEEWRYLWVAGPKGSGKTLFAFGLAHDLIIRGEAERVVANVENCFRSWLRAEDVSRAPFPLRAVLVVDEAGVAFERSHEVKPLLAFSRHDEIFAVFSSTIQPPYQVRALRVQRWLTVSKRRGWRFYRWEWWGVDHADRSRPLRAGLLFARLGVLYGRYKSGIAADPRVLVRSFQERYARLGFS